MTCCHRSIALLAYSSSITEVDIQCCLPLLIRVQIDLFSVPARQPRIMLTNSVCIIDDTFGVLSQFSSICKCEQLM
jgi:hypothetical protein